MQLTDTHCHIQASNTQTKGEEHTRALWAKAGDPTGDELVQRAAVNGVNRLICVGCTPEDSKLAIDFVKNRENCWASIGIHPHEASLYVDDADMLARFRGYASEAKVVAVGETGFDFYYNHSPKEAQEKLLRFQLDIGAEFDLPLIFHVREAFEDFWRVLQDYSNVRGVIHSFSATQRELDQILEHGLYIGLNGIMTFSKSAEQLAAARAVPLEKLLLETDAPYLTPTPYRGTINEPKYVRVVAEFLSELRGESLDVLADTTSHNAATLFRLS